MKTFVWLWDSPGLIILDTILSIFKHTFHTIGATGLGYYFEYLFELILVKFGAMGLVVSILMMVTFVNVVLILLILL